MTTPYAVDQRLWTRCRGLPPLGPGCPPRVRRNKSAILDDMLGGSAPLVLAGAHGTGVGPGAAVGVSSGESCRLGKHSNSGPTRGPVLVGVGAAVLVAAAYGVSQFAASGGATPGAGAASPSASISVGQPSVSTTSPAPTTTTTPAAGEAAAVAELAGCVARGQAA